MGVAAYNRGSRAVAEQISQEAASADLQLLRDLNAEPKLKNAPVPFGPIHFVPGHGGWFATCPTTGFGYWYKTLREAVRAFQVVIVSVGMRRSEVVFEALPRATRSVQ